MIIIEASAVLPRSAGNVFPDVAEAPGRVWSCVVGNCGSLGLGFQIFEGEQR